MSNSWVMSKVNPTDGHVQAGTFIIIPEDKRFDDWDLSDTSVSDTWETADFSAKAPSGTIALLVYLQSNAASANDDTMIITRAVGQTVTNGVAGRNMRLLVGGSTSLVLAYTGIIYAPDGIFQYRRHSSAVPVDAFRVNVRGYWVK